MQEMGKQPIEQVKGDLLAQEVDCIVNAANEHLQMGGGVAGAIRRADASGKIQAECDAIIDRHGIVPVGGAVLTREGDLGPVIHAVGPVYSKAFPERSTQELYQAYISALRVAFDAGFRTIAFPYISTGIFGFPRKEGIEVALRAARDFLDEHPDSFDIIRFVTLG